ncbi:MAG: hypothetical protein K8U03_05555 [Planctomycetia bacterium]|nr:hypothetical protein [Planctomycetia bacterium]
MASAAEGLGTIAVFVGVVYYLATSPTGCGAIPALDANDLRPVSAIQLDERAASSRTRNDGISALIADGVISNVVMVGTTPQVSTGPAWHGISFDDQQNWMSKIATQYADPHDGMVRLTDGQTAKPLGAYKFQSGLKLY